MDSRIGDVLTMKKPHPCGSREWEVLRVGADFRLRCRGCGHCYAICPKEAVELRGWGEGGGESVSAPVDADALLGMMKSRRSTRQFLDKPIPDDVMEKLLEAGRYAPTAENHQVVEFIVLDKQRDEIERKAVGLFRKTLSAIGKVVPWAAKLEIDDRFFFKGAL